MPKHRKTKSKSAARNKAKAKTKHAHKRAAAKSRRMKPKPRGKTRAADKRLKKKSRLAPKSKPAVKARRPEKAPAKRVEKAPGKAAKTPQKMDKATLKKALLKERIARAQAKLGGRTRSTRGLTAKERALVKEFERRELSPADAEARRERLKNLVVLGKERSYLTYAEINDHLPDDMLDAEQIENVIGMINDMGIQVYDEAPDAETLLMSDTTAPVADEEAVEEAEAALSTVDSEFGRTTDPVRMYMREMGSVELLTREGEIEIAKRIEDGLRHMIQAISACPTTIADILGLAERIEKDEMRVDEVVDGLIDPNAKDAPIEEVSEDDEEMEEELEASEDDDEEGGTVQTADQLKLKADALKRFATIRGLYNRMTRALARNGARSRAHIQARDAISNELMSIRFSAKQIESLCDAVRKLVEEVRSYERNIMEICVARAKMPRAHFIKEFPGKEGNLRWIKSEIEAGRPWSDTLERFEPAIVEQQQKLLDLQLILFD